MKVVKQSGPTKGQAIERGESNFAGSSYKVVNDAGEVLFEAPLAIECYEWCERYNEHEDL